MIIVMKTTTPTRGGDGGHRMILEDRPGHLLTVATVELGWRHAQSLLAADNGYS